ncbi:hypothetical protein EYZ49_12685 [Salmonella enterica subsp. salamae serovar 13,22:z:-]|nr:hypothetical protein EYZ49_12685 [Salmonella enterica subsp. salamae serovar 13,22:z:-]
MRRHTVCSPVFTLIVTLVFTLTVKFCGL